MIFSDIQDNLIDAFNKNANHPLQAFEWGEFRKKTGVGVIRRGVIDGNNITHPYQITVHKTPNFPYLIGYFPKGRLPSEDEILELQKTGGENNLSFIQLEPNIFSTQKSGISKNLKPSFHPLFTKYSFILDITLSEDELLKKMHSKTRYNIRLSQRHGVNVKIDNSEKSFKEYLKLTKETTRRQKFYAHDEKYHKLMWETLGNKENTPFNPNRLQAHLITAEFKNKILTTFILFTFKDTLYYPYGASSDENREVMSSTLTMWEAVKFGKGLGLNKFDMWGAANVPNPKNTDPYYGFHRFKEGFGATLTEFVGSYDLVINPLNYRLLTVADKVRWAYLKTKKLR